MSDRDALTQRWKNHYRNDRGGSWTGRADMDAKKDAEVTEIEVELAGIHTDEGHGPYVVNYRTGNGPRLVRDQKLDQAHREEVRYRRCVCGEEFSTESGEEVADDTTYDGYSRYLRAIQWPGFVWKGQQFPGQPRDTHARRGRVFVVHGDDAHLV